MILEKIEFNISNQYGNWKVLKKNCWLKIGVFEHLLTQNWTNQDWQLFSFFQTLEEANRKSKNMGLQGIISAWKWFQNLLSSKFAKKSSRFWRPRNQLQKWNSDLNFSCTWPSTRTQYKNCCGHLIGTYSKCHKYLGQK